MTMAAAGAIRRRHLPDGGIEWPLSEALDVLNRAMHPVSYYWHNRMAIQIASDSPAFLSLLIICLHIT
jgi:hypothetical protein